MDAAVASGATAVQGVRFDVKQRESLEREALKRATVDARARAEAAASGAGRAIDRVTRVEEPGTRPMPPPQPMMMMRQSAAAEQAQTPVVCRRNRDSRPRHADRDLEVTAQRPAASQLSTATSPHPRRCG